MSNVSKFTSKREKEIMEVILSDKEHKQFKELEKLSNDVMVVAEDLYMSKFDLRTDSERQENIDYMERRLGTLIDILGDLGHEIDNNRNTRTVSVEVDVDTGQVINK